MVGNPKAQFPKSQAIGEKFGNQEFRKESRGR
jgi:hypothetical protein